MRTSLAVAAGCLMAVAGAVSLTGQSGPTYYKDVLPILQANCQTCHRPGEVAPMSLLTYEQSRPWAQAIKKADAVEADAAVVCRARVTATSPTSGG